RAGPVAASAARPLSASALVSAIVPPPQLLHGGAPHDREVGPQARARPVLDVEANALVVGDVVPAGHLPESRQARAKGRDERKRGAVARDLVADDRPPPH